MSEGFFPGQKGEIILSQVDTEHTARAVGSGSLEVLASPVLAALFEQAACKAIADVMPAGTTSVGSYLEFKHMAPTPMGLSVTVSAELVAVDGRILRFALAAADDCEQIGVGTHQRVLVDESRFVGKAQRKQRLES